MNEHRNNYIDAGVISYGNDMYLKGLKTGAFATIAILIIVRVTEEVSFRMGQRCTEGMKNE